MGDFDDDFDNDSVEIDVSVDDDIPSTTNTPSRSTSSSSSTTTTTKRDVLSTTIRTGTVSPLVTLNEHKKLSSSSSASTSHRSHTSSSKKDSKPSLSSGSGNDNGGPPVLTRASSTSSARPVRLSSSLAGPAAEANRQKTQRAELKKLNEQRKKKVTKTQPPSEAIVKLAVPHKRSTEAISASYEDITNCFFKPRVSKFAQEIQVQPLADRIVASIKDSNQRRKEALKGPPAPDPKTHPFKPDLHHDGDDDKVPETAKGNLVKRMEADSKQRIAAAKEKATMKLCTFRPKLEEGSVKHNASITTPFMKRLANDLVQREQKKKALRDAAIVAAEAELKSSSLTRSTSENNEAARQFMTRMEGDLNTRRRKQMYRDQLFAGVTPSLAASQSLQSLFITRRNAADSPVRSSTTQDDIAITTL